MITVYYTLTYKEYKEHAHGLLGTEHIGHSLDEPLTDDSQIVLMVSGPRHVHHFLDKQNVKVAEPTDEAVKALGILHPVMRAR